MSQTGAEFGKKLENEGLMLDVRLLKVERKIFVVIFDRKQGRNLGHKNDTLQSKRRRRGRSSQGNRHQAFEFKEISQPGAEFRKKLENEQLMRKVRFQKVYTKIFVVFV